MKRIQINKMQGMSAYKLSHIVSNLKFERPNIQGKTRQDKTKKAVLRALCDRYPNVWPGLPDIAAKASCSPAQARRVLRELESKDRLIVDISTNTSHKFLEVPAKKGGYGNGSTPQYFILDRKIFDIYQQQQMWEELDRASSNNGSSKTANPIIPERKPTHMRTETHSYEAANARVPASEVARNPLTMSAEPTIPEPITLQPITTKPTTQPVAATGWLTGQVASILYVKSGSPRTVSGKERSGLNILAAMHGSLLTVLAFYHFVERKPYGVIGLDWPITVFLSEAELWIHHTHREIAKNLEANYPYGENPKVFSELRQTVSDLAGQYGLEPTDDLVSMLCELAYRQCELGESDSYAIETVEDYLRNCPGESVAA